MIWLEIHWVSLAVGFVLGNIVVDLVNHYTKYHKKDTPTKTDFPYIPLINNDCDYCNGSGLPDKIEPQEPLYPHETKCLYCGGTGIDIGE